MQTQTVLCWKYIFVIEPEIASSIPVQILTDFCHRHTWKKQDDHKQIIYHHLNKHFIYALQVSLHSEYA